MDKPLNGKAYFQRIQNVAYLCLGLPLVLFIYLYLESSVDELTEIIPFSYHVSLFVPVFLICVILIYWGMKKYRLLINRAITIKKLREKLMLYQKASAIRFTTYGVSALLIAFGFYLTNYQPFAILFGVMIVFFSINNPNTRKIVNELRLKKPEKEIILNGLDIP